MSKSIRAKLLKSKTQQEEKDKAASVQDDQGKKPSNKVSEKQPQSKDAQQKAVAKKKKIPVDVAVVAILFISHLLTGYIFHSTYIAAEAYSSPSIIMASRRQDGTRVIIDDYREAYYWLK